MSYQGAATGWVLYLTDAEHNNEYYLIRESGAFDVCVKFTYEYDNHI